MSDGYTVDENMKILFHGKEIEAGEVTVASPDGIGLMPARQDIEVIPADEPRQLKLGWKVTESIGIGWVNPRGVASGRKSTQNDSPRPKIKKTRLSDG